MLVICSQNSFTLLEGLDATLVYYGKCRSRMESNPLLLLPRTSSLPLGEKCPAISSFLSISARNQQNGLTLAGSQSSSDVLVTIDPQEIGKVEERSDTRNGSNLCWQLVVIKPIGHPCYRKLKSDGVRLTAGKLKL